jgi:mono/diheme cytochrome c family protein
MINNHFSGRALKTIFLVFVIMNLYSCNRGRNNPGWDYFPDMFYSTAYETNTVNPNFDDHMTMRVPAQGTIPIDFIPFQYTNDPESRALAGKELVNPFQATAENIESGKRSYSVFCIDCHGPAGDGNGHLFTSGLYPIRPLTISGASAVGLKDGEFYHTITLGIRSMGAYGSQIKPDDRWKIVLYIRKLQKDVNGETVK